MIHIKNLKIYGDMPPNFLKDPNVGPEMKQQKNKKSWGTFPNLQHFKGRKVC